MFRSRSKMIFRTLSDALIGSSEAFPDVQRLPKREILQEYFSFSLLSAQLTALVAFKRRKNDH